jgi:hypothetical protein
VVAVKVVVVDQDQYRVGALEYSIINSVKRVDRKCQTVI